MVKNGENVYGESGREIGKFLHFSPFFTMNTSPDRINVSEREYQLQVRLCYGFTCIPAGYANIYECDTFLLYNFPQINKENKIPADCNETQWEPHGICLEDTGQLFSFKDTR